MNLINIATGHINNILGINAEISKNRLEQACKKCVLSHRDGVFQDNCKKKDGGCGCTLSAKTSVQNMRCPQGIWANDWINISLLEQLNKTRNFTPNE